MNRCRWTQLARALVLTSLLGGGAGSAVAQSRTTHDLLAPPPVPPAYRGSPTDPPLGDTSLAPGPRPPEAAVARRFRPHAGWLVGAGLSLAAGYAVALAIAGSVAERANGSTCDQVFAAMQAAPFFGPINGWLTLEMCSLRAGDDLVWTLAEVPAFLSQLIGLSFLLVGLGGGERPRPPAGSNLLVAPYASSTQVGLDVTLRF